MYNVSKVSKRNTKVMGRSDIGLDDGESERSILSETGGSDSKLDGGIMKTVVHEVTSESRTISERSRDMESPRRFE